MLNKPFEVLEGIYVYILCEDKVREVPKEQLEVFLFSQMEEMTDTKTIYEIRDYYRNAYEWLFINLGRTLGIQLYSDGEIRINIDPCEIVDNKKCIFLKECDVDNRNLDGILYDELNRICDQGL